MAEEGTGGGEQKEEKPETIREQWNWERNGELEDTGRTNCSDRERIDQATEA